MNDWADKWYTKEVLMLWNIEINKLKVKNVIKQQNTVKVKTRKAIKKEKKEKNGKNW